MYKLKMPRGHHLPTEIRELIVAKHKDGKSQTTIAEEVKRNKSIVCRVIKAYKTSGRTSPAQKKGRPRKTSAREDRMIVRTVERKRFNTATAVTDDVNERGVKISRRTVGRRLSEKGLQARTPANKPLLSAANVKKRKDYVLSHVTWTPAQWRTVHFSDESSFGLNGCRGPPRVFRRKGERLDPRHVRRTVKFKGGTLMVWGMMSASGPGPLIPVPGTVNADVYMQIAKDHIIPACGQGRGTFQQDNAAPHKALKVKKLFEEEGVQAIDWPPQSPDLSPIENLWSFLGSKVEGRRYASKTELFDALEKEWWAIPPDMCKKLVESCADRCEAVLEAKGGWTKY